MDGIVYPKVSDYIEKFGGISELLDLEEYAKLNYVPIVMKDAARFLAFMVSLHRPLKILELGTAIGYSALVMALHSEAEIITVEREEKMREMALENIEKHGMKDRIRVVLSECEDFLSETEETFDFIFMDAGKSHYREYLDLSLPKLNPGGFILCDNVLYKGLVVHETAARKHRTNVVKLQKFLDYVHSREDLRVSLLTVSDGMLLIRRKEENE
ncbi:O-methyltransferase [Proteiniclasticum sp. C24MP]|uniref:O-methyltransferase n=1 Tax=Proteiniclasticum sp. C24MP TaxID=3374101 RepID=UPI003754F5D2